MTAGAFFDLDKTLIEGSSAIHFGRAAYRQGLMTRTQLARDLWANIRFRMRGSTDAGSEALRQRILDAIAGTRVRDLERLGHEVLAGVLPRVYPEVLREAYEHQDAGRRVFIVTAASHEMAELMAFLPALCRRVLGQDLRDLLIVRHGGAYFPFIAVRYRSSDAAPSKLRP